MTGLQASIGVKRSYSCKVAHSYALSLHLIMHFFVNYYNYYLHITNDNDIKILWNSIRYLLDEMTPL